MDFGFPSGEGLKKAVLTALGPNTARKFVAESLSLADESVIETFRNALRYSGKASVDAFLEYRPEFLEVGKAAMAYALNQLEIENQIYNAQENWYEHLFSRMNAPFDEFHNNKLSIITYNYDRSIEHFLFNALLNTYGKSRQDVHRKLQSIPIIHLHGQLGFLPWQSRDASLTRPYAAPNDASGIVDTIGIARRSIKIIHEASMVEGEDFQKARDVLAHSERLIFLGFGYDPVNLERLRIEYGNTSKHYYGTCVGKEKAEIDEIKGYFKNRFVNGHPSMKIKEFLRSELSL